MQTVDLSKFVFHAPPALQKQLNGSYLIVGMSPTVVYTKELFDIINAEYDRRVEEHRKLRASLKPVTTQVASSKDPNKFYTVTKNRDGSWECSCPGFIYRRKCSHIEKVQGKK